MSQFAGQDPCDPDFRLLQLLPEEQVIQNPHRSNEGTSSWIIGSHERLDRLMQKDPAFAGSSCLPFTALCIEPLPPPIAATILLLLQQQHLSRRAKLAGIEAIEVHPRRHHSTVLVASIPCHRMRTGCAQPFRQRRDTFTEDIVNG